VEGAAFAFGESSLFPNGPFASLKRISIVFRKKQIERSYISFLNGAAQSILCRTNLSFKFSINMNFL